MQGDILLKYWFLHSVFRYHFYITVGFRAFNLIVEVKVLVAQPHLTLQFTATLWAVAHQAPLSMEFSRQECWSGFPFPSLGEFPDPGIEPRSSALQADTLLFGPPGKFPIFTVVDCVCRLYSPSIKRKNYIPQQLRPRTESKPDFSFLYGNSQTH